MNFNISFEFVDNLGETTITRADRRWNGVTVFVSKSQFQRLSPAEKLNVLTHECSHAVVEFGLYQNPAGWQEVDGVKLPSVEAWADLNEVERKKAVADVLLHGARP